MRELILTNGTMAFVDDEDWARVVGYNWTISKTAIGRNVWNPIDKTIKWQSLANVVMRDDNRMFDHKDRNFRNNLKSNLRVCDASTNNVNKPKRKNCTSIYKGVSWHSGNKRWRAYIQKNRKTYNLGNYTNPIEAALAYNKKALELFGEFALLNEV